jgi:hypothetical protein
MTKRIEYLFLLPLLAALAITTLPVFASTGMSHCNDEDDADNADCNDQPDRVGNDEENDEDAPRDGPGGEDGTPEEEDEGEANCWGKVTSDAVSENDDDGIGGREFGEHTSNPVNDPDTEEEDNETPREGVGNQEEGHPSDHADSVGGAFSNEDCIDRED